MNQEAFVEAGKHNTQPSLFSRSFDYGKLDHLQLILSHSDMGCFLYKKSLDKAGPYSSDIDWKGRCPGVEYQC